ncbi:unnamed protein product, partial [Rotaria magnacalcarata]
MVTGEINIISQPGQSCWTGLDQAGYIDWTDQARPNFQSSAWICGLTWQAGSSDLCVDTITWIII